MDHKTPSNMYDKGVAQIMEREETIFKECSVCKKQVCVMIYECPSCKSKFCMICTLENNWKCPNCKQKLSLAKLDS
jgi:transcription initiation factor IIE alpha subunit